MAEPQEKKHPVREFVKTYPRFIPFCIILLLIAAIVALIVASTNIFQPSFAFRAAIWLSFQKFLFKFTFICTIHLITY